jgi:acyl carrier protein
MKNKLKELLANHLGVEVEDINDDDSFSQDLHTSPLDLADFVNGLTEYGFDTSKVKLNEIETFEDLAEALDIHE